LTKNPGTGSRIQILKALLPKSAIDRYVKGYGCTEEEAKKEANPSYQTSDEYNTLDNDRALWLPAIKIGDSVMYNSCLKDMLATIKELGIVVEGTYSGYIY
jgi:hypothetical protein